MSQASFRRSSSHRSGQRVVLGTCFIAVSSAIAIGAISVESEKSVSFDTGDISSSKALITGSGSASRNGVQAHITSRVADPVARQSLELTSSDTLSFNAGTRSALTADEGVAGSEVGKGIRLRLVHSQVSPSRQAVVISEGGSNGRSAEVVGLIASREKPREFDQHFELAALGPVEAMSTTDEGSSQLVVVGQSFVSPVAELGINVGDYVFAGSIDGGQLDFLIPVGEDYLQGVSEVRVIGTIEDVEATTAHFSIGDATFDYSNLLTGSPEMAVNSGAFVEVYGNQPTRGGSILLGIHGSGIGTLQGIHGSGDELQGIHGSGIFE